MTRKILSLAIAAAGLIGTAGAAMAQNVLPDFIVPGTVRVDTFDGVSDDLLTGGLGTAGLASATAPGFATATAPTVRELRRRAIYNNYRAIVDTTAGSGYGVLYGPNLNASYQDTGLPGLVPGREYLAYASNGQGGIVTVGVQIPTGFNPAAPCISTAPSSGSRGIYGAISIAEWGLKNNCAVALTDKGSGNGFHDLTADLTDDIAGLVGTPAQLGGLAEFAVPRDDVLNAYAASYPNRVAFKHAHSQANPERDWGLNVIQAIKFAFWAIKDTYPTSNVTPANTIVIATGISNGGGAVLKAGELDSQGLIKGIVAGEPQVQPDATGKVTINYGSSVFRGPVLSLFDAITLLDLYAPCASLSSQLTGTPLQSLEPTSSPALTVPARANRCASLADYGLLTSATQADRANESLAILNNAGLLPDANLLLAAHEYLGLWRSLAQTYANAYSRSQVADNLCGMSFAATDSTGKVTALTAAVRAGLFANGSGVPATGGVNQIAEWAANGPILEQLALSPSTGRVDLNIDSALCYRALATGTRVGNWTLTMRDAINGLRLREGVREVLANGNLAGRPTILVHGRNDALVSPTFSSRSYLALNSAVEGSASKVRYVEVTNAQHFDAFISSLFVTGTGAVQLLPLHYYVLKALDQVYANLRSGAALPGSQVVRTTPRGTTPITFANFRSFAPDIATTPDAGSAITAGGGTVTIPR